MSRMRRTQCTSVKAKSRSWLWPLPFCTILHFLLLLVPKKILMGGFRDGKWNLDNLAIQQPCKVPGTHRSDLMAVIIIEEILSKLATGWVPFCCHSFSWTAFLLKSESNKTSLRLIILELLNFNQCGNYTCLDILDGPQIQNTKKRFRPPLDF